MSYENRRKINVNNHIEKKGKFSYLSWAWAVDELLILDENATWEYREPVCYGETMMVFCDVTAFGVKRMSQLPVIDFNNKPIKNPNSFDVNTAMQRCLAKGIALHGIGLYIYAGEDLPEAKGFDALDIDMQTYVNDGANRMRSLLADGDDAGALAEFQEFEAEHEIKIILWHMFDSKERARMKATTKKESNVSQ